MAKTKSFAEKMLKSKKPPQEHDVFKVVSGVKNPQGRVKWESRVIRVKKGDNLNKALGL